MTILTRDSMTSEELRAEVLKIRGSAKKARRNKFNAVRQVFEGLRFDSKKELECWQYLKARLRAGEITLLERQVKFELFAHSTTGPVKVCTYIADFRFREGDRTVVADAKGVKTALFNLKSKLMKACHGIEVELM